MNDIFSLEKKAMIVYSKENFYLVTNFLSKKGYHFLSSPSETYSQFSRDYLGEKGIQEIAFVFYLTKKRILYSDLEYYQKYEEKRYSIINCFFLLNKENSRFSIPERISGK